MLNGHLFDERQPTPLSWMILWKLVAMTVIIALSRSCEIQPTMEICMWKAGLAGILLAAAIGSTVATADEINARRSFRPVVRAGSALTNAQIARVKIALKLTPAQEQYWQPVEAVLREIAFQSAPAATDTGQLRPARQTTTVVDPVKLQRLVSVAYPLVTSLSDEQKRHAMALAHALGLDSVAMAF
jgi:hypothetical protein